MGILLWIIYGGIVGWLASIITKNNARMGFIANIVVGLVGSLIGGWLAWKLGFGSMTRFHFGGMLISLLGAVILLTIINLIRGRHD